MEMDPSIDLCRIRPTFGGSPSIPGAHITESINGPPVGWTWNREKLNTKLPILTSNIIFETVDQVKPDPRVIDIKQYQELTTIKQAYNSPLFQKASLITNPYEKIGKSIFMNRAGVKMANMDAVFGLLGHTGGLLATKSGGNFYFCDLAGGPGAFSQYILWRRPESFGVGISLLSPNQDIGENPFAWKKQFLDLTRFQIYEGSDKTGNLITQARNFIDYVKIAEFIYNSTQITIPRIDLIVADGGIDVEGKEERQEFLSTPVILSEIYIGVVSTTPGGSFVCKVFDTVTTAMVDLLFLLSLTFETLTIFKPMSSRPANSERYVICTNKLENTDSIVSTVIDILANAWTQLNPNLQQNNHLISLVSPDNISLAFLDYIKQTNQVSITSQIEIGEQIIKFMNSMPITVPEFNLDHALIIWNLPSNLDRTYLDRTISAERPSSSERPSSFRGGRGQNIGTRRGTGRGIGMERTITSNRQMFRPRASSPDRIVGVGSAPGLSSVDMRINYLKAYRDALFSDILKIYNNIPFNLLTNTFNALFPKWYFLANVRKTLNPVTLIPTTNIIIISDLNYSLSRKLSQTINKTSVPSNAHLNKPTLPPTPEEIPRIEIGSKMNVTSHQITLTQVQFDRLKFLYKGANFDRDTIFLVRLYDLLGGRNNFLSIPLGLLQDELLNSLDPSSQNKPHYMELFGSPLNTQTITYNSAFQFEKELWSSSGSFFDYDLEENTIYIANPPFDETIMLEMVNRLLNQFNRNLRLDVIILLPVWDPETKRQLNEKVELDRPFEAYDTLVNSSFLIEQMILLKDSYMYYDYFSNKYIPVSNSHILHLANYDSEFDLNDFTARWLNINSTN